mgnify:FL=1
MSEEKYQGWTNWETWNVNLWLTNDQSVSELTKELLEREYVYGFKRVEALRDWVYDLVHGHKEEGLEPYITDDISLHRVNYEEIIEAFKEK